MARKWTLLRQPVCYRPEKKRHGKEKQKRKVSPDILPDALSKGRRGHAQTERLAADGFEVRQRNQGIVLEVHTAVLRARIDDLGAQLLLHVWVQAQQVQDPRERVRGRVRAREDERPKMARWRSEQKAGALGQRPTLSVR